jgi:hypothetical protein
LRLRAAGIAVLALLIAPATANASARIDVECERVQFNYSQWTSGPPDTSHSRVWVDGVIVFDQIVSFPGSTHVLEVPLNISDGRQHTIRARHEWSNHETGTQDVQETVTCGSPAPPAEQPPAPPAQPPAPPAPPVPTTPAGAPTPPSGGSAPESGGSAPTKAERQKAKRKAKRQKAKRRRQLRRERERARERATNNRLPRTTG